MKAGTAARAVYWIAVLVTVAVATFPIASMIADVDTEPVGAGVPAVYDLRLMDERTLADNLERAASVDGVAVFYGDASVAFYGGSARSVAAAIVASGAEEAIVRDADGGIVTQDRISYGNATITGQRIGVVLPSTDGISDLRLGMRLVSPDGLVDLPAECRSVSSEGALCAEYVLPIVAYNLVAAYGCSMSVSLGTGYEGLADADVSFSQPQDILSYKVSADSGSSTIRVDGGLGPSSGTGSIGRAAVSFSGDSMTVSCAGILSQVLKDSLIGGCLTVETDGISYTMGVEASSALISAVGLLEAGA